MNDDYPGRSELLRSFEEWEKTYITRDSKRRRVHDVDGFIYEDGHIRRAILNLLKQHANNPSLLLSMIRAAHLYNKDDR